ncbi:MULTISPECIES: anti-virulence regulator CigR family protein [Pseudomonas]|jgi:Ni/Co efflux regulator RcnB|uniref:Integral membrane protein n=1 Tax=Pseudomonas wadenswilerensis TaxID=1785161 RepID=A0A380T1S9_9PSED|nr:MULTISPECIES: anti-virulence regulator CigR family protein [Pseudomonas]MCE5984474.1 RcnB family protein [Pseudomonas sp. LF19]UVM19848.1 RcnB family protein [Pseudomonas wadenswilerensis]SPO66942.1 conserved exported protein of unknown function [Pseudomonas sp. JV241A]SUQ63476.1 hypothetical protein CCOS864_02927 [Pseudomonas wadenswilerensis]
MFRSRLLVVVATSLSLALGSLGAVADPGNGKGNPGHGQGKQGGQGASQKGGKSADQWSHGPAIDRSRVINVLLGYPDYWSRGADLPPGVRKNLARGKPLPPGIAKKLDDRLIGRLPHYDGYEWRQAGTDLILVAIATGIIYEVLTHVLD